MTRDSETSRLLPDVLAMAARLRINIAAETTARLERFDFDGKGGAYLLTTTTGGRYVVFVGWRATSRTRLDGYAMDDGNGGIHGLPARAGLHYGETPPESDLWLNVPGGAWTAAKAMTRDLLAMDAVA